MPLLCSMTIAGSIPVIVCVFIMEIVRKFFSHISGSATAQDQYVFLSYTSSASLLHTSLVSRRILEKSQK